MKKTLHIRKSFLSLGLVNLLLRFTGVMYHGAKIGWKSWIKSEIIFGYGSKTGWGLVTRGSGKFEVGRYCAIGEKLTVITSNHDYSSPVMSYKLQEKLFGCRKIRASSVGVIFGHDVWIGDNVTVVPGVHVGNGSIVGAGSVVTKNVDSFTIVAGNPAKVIGMRFNQEQINYLNEIKWWELEKDELPSFRHHFINFESLSCDE